MRSPVSPYTVLVVVLLAWHYHAVESHGFGEWTYVRTPAGWEGIPQIAQAAVHEAQHIVSYDTYAQQRVIRHTKTAGTSETTCYMRLCFDGRKIDDLLCTPTQEFYLPLEKRWAPAYSLRAGHVLLSECSVHKMLTSVELIKEKLTVYTLETEEPHTFLVGCHSILTHNVFLEVAVTIGMRIPFGTIIGGAAGGFFGPATFYGGCMLGAMIGVALKALCSPHEPTLYELSFNVDDIEAYRSSQDEAMACLTLAATEQSDKYALYRQSHQKHRSPQRQNSKKSGQGSPPDPEDPKKRNTEKVANMSALFALNTFGKRLKECSEATKYLYDRHVRIFRVVKDCIEYHLKKGYLFYLDTLHYDHIEVFSENGKRCVSVLNLDGSFNIGKYATAIARPRNIKEYLK